MGQEVNGTPLAAREPCAPDEYEGWATGPRWLLPADIVRKAVLTANAAADEKAFPGERLRLVDERAETSFARRTIFFKVEGAALLVAAFRAGLAELQAYTRRFGA